MFKEEIHLFDTFKPSNFSRCHVSLPECDPDFGGGYIEDMAAPSRSTLHKTLKKQGQVVTSSHGLSPWHTCCDCQGPQEPLSSQAGRLKQTVKCHLHCNYPGIKAVAFIIRILFFRMPFWHVTKNQPKIFFIPAPPTQKKKGYQSTLRKILRIFDALNFTWILPDFHHPAFAIWKPFPLGQSHGKVVPTNQRTLRTSSRAFSSQRKPTQRQHPPNVRPGKAGNTNGDIFFDLLPDIFPSFGKNIQEFEFDEISFSFPWMVLKSSVFLLIFFWDRVLKSLGT